jgi:hypothetical protein
MAERKQRTTAGDKTICLPIAEGIDYEELVKDSPRFRAYLDQQIEQHPALFPTGIEEGDWFHGLVAAERMALTTRRIRLKRHRAADQLRPDTVMPDMVGSSEAVEKGLYLRRYGVPYAGIAHVLGHSAMYWDRATQALGRPSMVGRPVKDPAAIPPSPDRRREASLVVGRADLPCSDSSTRLLLGRRDC